MNKLKELRNKTGLSRPEINKKYGIPIRTLEDWENQEKENKKLKWAKKLYENELKRIINNPQI